MFRKMLITGATAVSLLVSGCAGNDGGDMAGALLIGAAVVGLGVLAATSSDDSDDDDDYERNSYRHNSGGYSRHDERRRRHRNDNDYGNEYRYAGNGRCDDPSYRTSNGGHAASGTDERDCRRFGDGRK